MGDTVLQTLSQKSHQPRGKTVKRVMKAFQKCGSQSRRKSTTALTCRLNPRVESVLWGRSQRSLPPRAPAADILVIVQGVSALFQRLAGEFGRVCRDCPKDNSRVSGSFGLKGSQSRSSNLELGLLSLGPSSGHIDGDGKSPAPSSYLTQKTADPVLSLRQHLQ